jgi:hypothetical protein
LTCFADIVASSSLHETEQHQRKHVHGSCHPPLWQGELFTPKLQLEETICADISILQKPYSWQTARTLLPAGSSAVPATSSLHKQSNSVFHHVHCLSAKTLLT